MLLAAPLALAAAAAGADPVTIEQIDLETLQNFDSEPVVVNDGDDSPLARIVQIDPTGAASNSVSLYVDGQSNGLSASTSLPEQASALGLESGGIEQFGQDNLLRLVIEGEQNAFSVVQHGVGNSVTAQVLGQQNSLAAVQSGSFNVIDVIQNGQGNSAFVLQR
jgi:hypothetical protein